MTFFGSPNCRPTDRAATASVGATTEPSTRAGARVRPGTIHQATTPVRNVDTITSATPSDRIGRRLRIKLTKEKSSAAE